MYTFSIQRNRYIELMKNPLMFLRYVNESTKYSQSYKWVPVDNTISGEIKLYKIPQTYCTLVVVERVETEEENGTPKSVIKFKTRNLNLSNSDDCRLLVNSFILRSYNTEDKYAFIHLLWAMNYENWSVDLVAEVLRSYDSRIIDFVLNNGIAKFAKCLSKKKQQDVKQLMLVFGKNYNIYMPSLISDALKCITPLRDYECLNIFELVDYVVKKDKFKGQFIERKIDENTSNPLLCLYRWLNDDNAVINHASLVSLFSILPLDICFYIVKRYMHDVRKGKTSFDPSILEAFINNPYENFIRYRYCISTPQMPVSLVVPLLCDCILTINKTNGISFQTFDGILDLAIHKSETANPSVYLGLGCFIPKCKGGVKYNPEFKGFIDYALVCELDESKFNQENVNNTIKMELNGGHYYKCKNVSSPFENRQTGVVEEEIIHEDKWCISKTNCLLPAEVLIEELSQDSLCVVDLSKLTTQVMAKHIRSLVSKCEEAGANRYVIYPSQENVLHLLKQYSRLLSIRYFPNSDSVVGVKLNRTDINETDSAELNRRVVESLKQELGVDGYNGKYFELPYNEEQHRRLLRLYYYNTSNRDLSTHDINGNCSQRNSFLRSIKLRTTDHFCAPKISDTPNMATGMKYFWCRGHECYENGLGSQLLKSCESWKNYSLYHMIEILGFRKLQETEIGLEPDKAISEFIACANKVNKKFEHLRCRCCGHLMYTDKESGFNRYNYFSCSNPSCPEYHHSVYLNYCFKCKSGLIDSRDTSKCPHGWYICPACLACCDDAQYERQAQRYVLSNRPIPGYIRAKLGTGHNDKNKYFCPQCGGAIEDVIDDRHFPRKVCSQCGWVHSGI